MITKQAITAFIKQYTYTCVFVFFVVLAFVIYYPAHNSLLIDDGMAGLVEFKKQGYSGWIDSFQFPSLYYMHDFFVLLIYCIGGKNSFVWFLAMLSLHCLNAALSFRFFNMLFVLFNVRKPLLISFTGALLFLLSPYQTENVVWAATLHYNIAMAILLYTCILLLQLLPSTIIHFKHVALICLLHVVAITTIELSLFFPAVYSLLAVLLLLTAHYRTSVVQFVLRIVLPLSLITIFYFAATLILKGNLIPHYGDTHLQNFSFAYYIPNIAKHTVKLLTLVHFAPYQYRESIYAWCEHWKTVALGLSIVTTLAAFILWRQYGKKGVLLFLAMCAMAFVVLFPALNMYFMFLFTPENDRLSYFYSLFLYQILSFVLVSTSLYVGMAILIALFGIGIFFLHTQVTKWHQAGTLHNNLIESFTWFNAPQVYVLNAPANYNGVYQFRNDKRLPWAIHFFKDENMVGRITSVMSGAYASLHDSTQVSILNDSTLQVDFTSNGGWLMHERVGASNYSTPEYSVTVDPWKPSYQVVFHNKRKDAAYIYATDNVFKKLEGF